MKKKQAAFTRYIMRREGFEHQITTGELEKGRRRVSKRERKVMTDSFGAWINTEKATSVISIHGPGGSKDTVPMP